MHQKDAKGRANSVDPEPCGRANSVDPEQCDVDLHCLPVPVYMSLITRKSVFGVSDQVRLKPACSAKETSWSLEISAIASRDIILSRQ